jgi:hypothetical protein
MVRHSDRACFLRQPPTAVTTTSAAASRHTRQRASPPIRSRSRAVHSQHADEWPHGSRARRVTGSVHTRHRGPRLRRGVQYINKYHAAREVSWFGVWLVRQYKTFRHAARQTALMRMWTAGFERMRISEFFFFFFFWYPQRTHAENAKKKKKKRQKKKKVCQGAPVVVVVIVVVAVAFGAAEPRRWRNTGSLGLAERPRRTAAAALASPSSLATSSVHFFFYFFFFFSQFVCWEDEKKKVERVK